MVVTMNNGITLLEQLPLPTIKEAGILYRIDESAYKVAINGLKIEPNPHNKKRSLKITVSFTFIDNGGLIFEMNSIDGNCLYIEDGNICNHIFFVDKMQNDLYIDNTSTFYSIVNYVLQIKGLIPNGNDKAIKISEDKLKEYLKGETIILKTIYEDAGAFTFISAIVPIESLMVGGL